MTTAPKLEFPQGRPLFNTTWRAVSEANAGVGVLSTGAFEVTTTANALELNVVAGDLWYPPDEQDYSYGGGTLTLSSGNGSADRWDLLYFDTGSSTVEVREGTAQTNPVVPDIQGGEVFLAYAKVAQGATDIADEEVHNWRSMAQIAAETRLDDSAGEYQGTHVEAALTEVIRQAGDDPLNGPLDLSGYSGGAVLGLGDDPGGFGPIVDATATSSPSAGTELSYTFALDSTTVLQIYGEADGSGGLQNPRVNISNSDIYAGNTLLYNSSTEEFQQNRLGGPASDLTSYPLPIGDLDSPYPLPDISDLDLDGNDLNDSAGPGTLYSASDGFFLRAVLDDRLNISGPKTSNYTSSDEEIITADTSGSTVTITLASADAEPGNVVRVVDVGGAAGTNNITIDTEGSENIDGGSSRTIDTNYRAFVLFSDGTNWFTESGTATGGGFGVEDNGTTVLGTATGINFSTDLSVTDDGDGTITVDTDAGGVSVLSTGTFTHTGASSTTTTVAGVTTDETANLYVEVGVDADPSFNADYAFSYSHSEAWDDSDGQVDVDITATWDTDPGSGNDVVLDYRIYTLDVSVSKSRIQNLVDSPNGHVPTALVEDGESVEISVPVVDGETLSVYRWAGYKISDGTAPTGLEVQILDGSDTVQASENTTGTEDTSAPVASFGNATGSRSMFKLRVNNGTGTDYITDGVGGLFAYVVE